MTTLAISSKHGITVRLPTGVLTFIPESPADWEREREVLAFPIRVTVAQRVARATGINLRSIRVVRRREELG